MSFDHLVHQARQYSHTFSRGRLTELAAGQEPVALFITCSDSRVVPAGITGATPGELFELRTAGNAVPKYAPGSASSEMATIEYAVLQLQVPEVVLCGHSHCGAVKALNVCGRGLEALPAMRGWLGTDELGDADAGESDPAVRASSKQHLRRQLTTLREYPFVAERLASGQLRLHGWFFDIETGSVSACSPHDPEADFTAL